ncbi:MAG: 4-(cytidine 5'-diphospho)-2-C-methyl-D-erythritol kinase [Negativicutes bacterium]|nr:4-(cytidine 5'-diphospho)-2-C-methyl-D-erythritol kinase [Negativicutes bacterium]
MKNKPLILAACAKINLALDILHKRNDGYHEVAMVMQSIALADGVVLSDRDAGISVTTNLAGLDCGPSNLAYRAADLLAAFSGVRRGVHIELDKRIPLAAGLAGGSSDAAAVLAGLNRFWGLGLPLAELERLGATLGSDVPFCLRGGTMLATGRGEVLTPLPALPRVWVVLAKPAVEVSTAWAYQNYRPEAVDAHPDIPGLTACLEKQDLAGVARRLGNVLESVTIPAHPEIAALKQEMIQCGAMACLMSGSGPTVFGLAGDKAQARRIAASLKTKTDALIMISETIDSIGGEDGTTLITDQTGQL